MTEPLILTSPSDHTEQRDVRYTPAWVTEALLYWAPPSTNGRPVLDPAAGDGAILRVLMQHGYPVEWCEIRPEEADGLAKLGRGAVCNWLDVAPLLPDEDRLILTNPPYSCGADFMTVTLDTHPAYCAALLRLNHLGSASWFDFWRKHPLTGMLVLGSRRPSFSADGKTDASEYFWAVWQDGPKWIEVV
jgi:hypothetical protein